MPTDSEIARLSIRSPYLNSPPSTCTKAFCVSNPDAPTLAQGVTFEPLLTPADGAKLLGIHAKTLIKMARAELIQAIRIGKHWRFRASWIGSQVCPVSSRKEEV